MICLLILAVLPNLFHALVLTEAKLLSEQNAKDFLMSITNPLFTSNLENDCVEEFCTREEFLEVAENNYKAHFDFELIFLE